MYVSEAWLKEFHRRDTDYKRPVFNWVSYILAKKAGK